MGKRFQVLFLFLLINCHTSPAFSLTSPPASEISTIKKNDDAEFAALISQARKEALSGNYPVSLKYILAGLEKAKKARQFKEAEALITYIYSSTDNLDYLNPYYQKLEAIVTTNLSSPAFEMLIGSYEAIKNYEGIINLYRLKLLTDKGIISGQEKSLIFEKLGDIYDLLKQPPLNTDNYKRAIEFDDKNQAAREKLAFNQLLNGDIKAAESNYKRLLDLNRDSDNAHLGIGLITYIKGDAKNAWEEFKLIKNKDRNAALLELISRFELSKGTVSNLFRYWAF